VPDKPRLEPIDFRCRKLWSRGPGQWGARGPVFVGGVALAVFAAGVAGLADETVTPPKPEAAAQPLPASPPDAVREAIKLGYPATVDIAGITRSPEGVDQGYAGSGVLIHPAGYILTNNHVVGEGRLTAVFSDGKSLPCRILARHAWEDIAVIKVDADRPLPAVPLGRNGSLQVGDPVVVIGNPNGLSHTVTTGIVSRLAAGYAETGHIQTTAAVNGGNSGGPLLNEKAELIGVVSAKVSGEAIGLAIPIDRVRRLFAEMMLEEASRGWRLGMALDAFADEAKVTAAPEGGPAHAADVRTGDVVASVAGTPVRHGLDFYLLAADRKPEEPLPLELRRGAETLRVTVTPTEVSARPALEGDFVQGIAFEAFKGNWSLLPDFSPLTPEARGWTGAITHKVPGAGVDLFALRFRGFVEVPADGAWSFYTVSDDGSRLWIGEELVVDNDGPHGPTEKRGVVRLRKGKHAIRVEHFEGTGGEALQVLWSGPGTAKQEIPAAAYFVRP